MHVPSPTYEELQAENARLMAVGKEDIQRLLGLIGCIEVFGAAFCPNHSSEGTATSLECLICKLAASEETVRELHEWASQLKAMIEAEGNPKDNSRPTQWRQSGVLAEIYAGLAQMVASPPNGASARAELAKLRVIAKFADEMVNGPEDGRRYYQIKADLQLALAELRAAVRIRGTSPDGDGRVEQEICGACYQAWPCQRGEKVP